MELVEVGARIADGEPIDWSSSALTPADAATLNVLHYLQVLEQIAALHGATLPPARTDLLPSLGLGSTPEPAGAGVPERWGRLDVVRRVGRGTFGDVYLAHDRSLDRPVALKLLRHREGHRDSSRDVIEEGRLLARVRHPNIVAVYGAERLDDRVGVWTEFIDGVTLADELRARGPLPVVEAVSVGVDLCGALQAVHDAGLLHRDIKAQNVMRDAAGRVLLTDFGAGRLIDEDRPSGELAGTPLYLAPEVLAGGPASKASDVYALGVLLHFLISGTYPVSGRSVRDLRDAHELGRRTSIATSLPDVPEVLASAIERATDPDPARRFPSATALADTLRQVLPSAERIAKPRTVAKPILAIAVLAAVAAAGYLIAQWRSDDAMLGLGTRQFWPAWQATANGSAISPDAKWVLCTVRATLQLARCPLDGDAPSAIGSFLAVQHPLLSPDGRRVAYIRYQPGVPFSQQNTGDLHVASIDGSNDRVALSRSPDDGILSLVGWSRDGTTIGVRLWPRLQAGQSGAGEEVTLVSTATLEAVASGMLPVGAFFPQLSHDGRSLVFERAQKSDSDIWTMDVRSGAVKRVVEDPANDTRPFWSASGSNILFTSNRGGTRGLWRVTLRDGHPEGPPELVRDLGRAVASPFGFTTAGQLLVGLDLAGFDSYVAEVDPATATVIRAPTRIARDPLDANATPDWSPDGKQLAFISDAGARDMVTVQRESGEVLFRFPVDASYYQARLRWMPDGRSAVIGMDPPLPRYDMATGREIEALVPERGKGNGFEIDAAAELMVYRSGGEILLRHLSSGHERVMLHASALAGQQVSTFSVDSSGQRLALVRRHAGRANSLDLADEGGMALRTVSTWRDGIGLGPWTRDGKYLFFTRSLDRVTSRSEIAVLEVGTGVVRALPIVMPQIRQLRLHPDGRRLAFVTGPPGQEMALLTGPALK